MGEEYTIKKYTREEEDGSKTIIHALNCSGVLKTHNPKGPAVVNKDQKLAEHYLYGIKYSKDDWEKRIKIKAY
eukprot:SAG11_NODE_33_length_22289_cov_12.857999_19_plen_73_part_00